MVTYYWWGYPSLDYIIITNCSFIMCVLQYLSTFFLMEVFRARDCRAVKSTVNFNPVEIILGMKICHKRANKRFFLKIHRRENSDAVITSDVTTLLLAILRRGTSLDDVLNCTNLEVGKLLKKVVEKYSILPQAFKRNDITLPRIVFTFPHVALNLIKKGLIQPKFNLLQPIEKWSGIKVPDFLKSTLLPVIVIHGENYTHLLSLCYVNLFLYISTKWVALKTKLPLTKVSIVKVLKIAEQETDEAFEIIYSDKYYDENIKREMNRFLGMLKPDGTYIAEIEKVANLYTKIWLKLNTFRNMGGALNYLKNGPKRPAPRPPV